MPKPSDSPNLRAVGVDAWLADAVDRLTRGDPAAIESLLCSVGEPIVLDGTRATARTHFVLRDGNGRPRVKALADKLGRHMVDYCIPRSRIKDAAEYFNATGSTERLTQLSMEARGLFSTLSRSGEGGELLLYLMLEVALRIPQILCKMSLKTNSQMHVHGTDGLHASVEEDGTVALYWGEAKLHASVNSAIDGCFESIAPFLSEESSEVAKRDLLLVRDNLDLGADDVTEALVGYFIDDDPRTLQLRFRGACLIGFDIADYPAPFERDGVTIRQEIVEQIGRWHSRIVERINIKQLTSFELEVFCVPFPSVEEFRTAVRQSIGVAS